MRDLLRKQLITWAKVLLSSGTNETARIHLILGPQSMFSNMRALPDYKQHERKGADSAEHSQITIS